MMDMFRNDNTEQGQSKNAVPHNKQRLWLARRDARRHVIGYANDVGAIVWFHRAVASRAASVS